MVEGEYRTGLQEHVYMEPQGLVATAEAGKVTIYGSMQCPYYIKKALIQALGCDPAQVRVVQTTTGGAFGGKEEYPSLLAGHVAFAALKTGRPVQLIFDRAEDIQPFDEAAPVPLPLPDGARCAAAGSSAWKWTWRLDGGAYAGLSSVVLQRAMFAAAGVYHVENLRVRGGRWPRTRCPPARFAGSALRRPSLPSRCTWRRLPRELGLDPLDFKMAHAYRKGDRTATSGLMRQDIKLPEIVARLDEMSGYRRKRVEFAHEQGTRAARDRSVAVPPRLRLHR